MPEEPDNVIKNLITLSEDDKKLIHAQLTLERLSEFDIARFIKVCERSGLDPITRQIYARGQNTKVRKGQAEVWITVLVIITSIDGFRAMAARSGEYRGQTKPEWLWCDKSAGEGAATWKDHFIPRIDNWGNAVTFPDAARVGVHRSGFHEPCYGYANFYSFVQWKNEKAGADGQRSERKPSQFWQKMPETMLSKTAEAQAFRKAFPLVFGGIYVEEEINASANQAEKEDEDESEIAQAPEDGLPEGMTAVECKPLPPVEPAPEKAKRTRSAKAPAESLPAPTEIPDPVHEDPKAPPAEDAEEEDAENPWKSYVIQHLPEKYRGRKTGDLTLEELETMNAAWVVKYAERIAQNPGKAHEAKMIVAALEFRRSEK